jgi:hypothetical protein
MKYVMLIMNTEAQNNLSAAEVESWTKDVLAWYEKWGASGELVSGGEELDNPDKARTIRADGVTDGPYIEAKEVIGGFSTLEVESMDRAVEIASSWPGVDRGLITIEVRPVYQR